MSDALSKATDSVTAAGNAAADSAKDAASKASGAAADAAATAADSAKAAASKATDAATKAADSASTAASKATDSSVKAAEKTVASAEKKVAAAEKKVTSAQDKVAEAVAAERPPAPPRSMDEIESDLDAARTRLAERIDELEVYVQPKNILDRQLARVKGVFVDEFGGVRPDRVAIAAGAVVAFVVVSGLVRRRRRG